MSFDWFLNPVMNQYADFSGRATRQAYWMFVLIQFIISIGLSIIGAVTDMEYLSTVFMLAIFVPSLAIVARRLHDIGKSGWWWLIILVPFIGIIIYIVFLATKGDANVNVYGYPVGQSAIPVPVPPQPTEAATVVVLGQPIVPAPAPTQTPTPAPTWPSEGL